MVPYLGWVDLDLDVSVTLSAIFCLEFHMGVRQNWLGRMMEYQNQIQPSPR